VNRGYGAGGATSVIDGGSYFNGVYRSPGDLLVKGEFEGEIQCQGTLTVADSARVSGAIQAGHVMVSGRLEGQVDCAGRLEILATGQVSAQVLTGTVVVRDGAFYEGDMRMRTVPDGLPERELTAEPGPAGRPELSPVPPAVNGREQTEAPSLRAVSD
jgi:cytoskeletal protein CcmA (bactofilin family)